MSQVEWINPHAFIHLDVAGRDGAVVTWLVAVAGAGGLAHAGASKDTLKRGDVISIEVFALKDGKPRAEAKQSGILTLANGQRVRMPVWSASGRDVPFRRLSQPNSPAGR